MYLEDVSEADGLVEMADASETLHDRNRWMGSDAAIEGMMGCSVLLAWRSRMLPAPPRDLQIGESGVVVVTWSADLSRIRSSSDPEE